MLKKSEDLIKPREGFKPWERVENLKVVDGKPVMVEKKLKEADAEEFDNLLADVPIPDEPKTSKKEPEPVPTVVQDGAEFTVKRSWAKKAESDVNTVYDGFRRSKCLESIADLEKWTCENVIKFEKGKMFETLFMSDDLFDNPGLEQHAGARPFLENMVRNNAISRESNSKEFGFKALVRQIVKDIFKDKVRGLILRNIEATLNSNPYRAMRVKFGKFLDEVLKHSEEIDGNHGRKYTKIDKNKLEHIKNAKLGFTTRAKNGTYEINVYCEDMIIPKNSWLLLLLQVGMRTQTVNKRLRHQSMQIAQNKVRIRKSTIHSAGKISQL